MFSVIDALIDSVIYDNVFLDNNYANLSDSDFIKSLNEYYGIYIKEIERDTIAELNNHSPLNIYIPKTTNMELFSKSLLTMDSVIIDDVIINVLIDINDMTYQEGLVSILKQKNKFDIDSAKEDVAEFIRFIKKYSSLIRCGVIKVIASKNKHFDSEKKKDLLENDCDKHLLFKIMKKDISDLYLRSIKIKPFVYVNSDGAIKFAKKKQLTSDIMMEIKNCTSHYINGYRHSTIIPVKKTGDGLHCRIEPSIPESREKFDNWVMGAINRTAIDHYTHLLISLDYSRAINSSLGCDCQFTGKILDRVDRSNSIFRKMLEVDTPFLTGVSIENISNIREEYGESFEAYKGVIRNTAKELELATEKYQVDLINREFKEKIYDEGMIEVEKAIYSMKRSAVLNASIDFGIAALGLLGGPFVYASVVSVLLQTTKTISSIKKDADEIKKHPSYFLLKTIKHK